MKRVFKTALIHVFNRTQQEVPHLYGVCVCVGGGEDVTPHLLHGPHVIYASTWQVWIPELHY